MDNSIEESKKVTQELKKNSPVKHLELLKNTSDSPNCWQDNNTVFEIHP